MSRSSSATAAAFLQGADAGPEDAGDEDFADAWGEMGDMDDDDTTNNNSGADAWDAPSNSPPTTSPAASRNGQGAAAKASPAPFDDGSEPDFAGWLAAQARKKNSTSKPLPKGLAKSSAKKPLGSSGGAPAKKAVPAPKKKIDMKPKESADDDGWGDGW